MPEAFGMDISDFSIKTIKLERSGRKINLASYGKTNVPSGVIEKGLISKNQDFVRLVRESIEEISGKKLGTKWVVVSVPEREMFLRVVQLPLMKDEDIKRAIKWGAEENIPLNIEEAYFDWERIPPPLGKSLDHIDVTVVASPRATIDSYIKALEAADLKVLAVEMGPTASMRAIITPELAKETVLVIDVGALKTVITVYSAGAVRFTSTMDISGHTMTEAIAKELNVSFSEAEKIKIEFGFDKDIQDGKIYNSLKPIVDKFAKQIGDYINFYEEHDFHEHGSEPRRVNKVLICGGSANIKNLADYCSKKIKMDIELANPWGNILKLPLKETPEISYEKSLGYTTAIGLALRGVSDSK